jgi:D-tyrosyl-tRNA(Tyr) deacylase
MRVVIQRVKKASVTTSDGYSREIKKGLLVLVGIEHADDQTDVEWLVGKISALRIFDDENGVMNLSVETVNGDVLIVSQFTLQASTKKGNRPSYIKAAPPELSVPLYEHFVKAMEKRLGRTVPTGVFGANMEVSLINDGPVTIIIDSKQRE